VINMMEEQKKIIDKGATMRLGSYECALTPGSKAAKAYKAESVRERHRHRYEVNNAYVGQLQRAGLLVSGVNPRRNLVEIVELKDHPFFLAVQFHPEFQSKPLQAHPLFAAFIAAALKSAKPAKTVVKKRKDAKKAKKAKAKPAKKNKA
jgi:CTP synthase